MVSVASRDGAVLFFKRLLRGWNKKSKINHAVSESREESKFAFYDK